LTFDDLWTSNLLPWLLLSSAMLPLNWKFLWLYFEKIGVTWWTDGQDRDTDRRTYRRLGAILNAAS